MADKAAVQLTEAIGSPLQKRHARERYPDQLPTAFTKGGGDDAGIAAASPTRKPQNPASRRSPSMMSEFSDMDGDASDYESDRGTVGARRRPRLERRMSTIDVLYQMQNLQLDDDDDEHFQCCDFSAEATSIHPHSTFRTRWDLAISLMLAYNAFVIPYRVCFGDVLDTTQALWYVDRLIDAAFIIDVVANFYTGYVRSTDGQVELTPKLVRWNYFTTWFAIDFVSSVPYEVIVMIIVDSEDPRQYSDSPQLLRTAKALKIARYIRFLKVVKVLRLVRAVHIFKRFEKALFMRHSASSIAKFLGFIIYLNHVLACIFYIIGDYERGEGRISWLDHESLENQRSNLPLAYLYAFYFSLMTTTTIGYGDVHPVSASGRVFALVAMAIGACVFSYGVTHVITLMSSLNKQEQAFREKMDRIATYMSFRNLPSSLRSDVREFFHYTHSTKTEKRMLEVEKEILAEMSPSLSHEVVLYVNRQIVDKVVFLREVDHRFFQRIVRNLEPATFAPNELVMKEGEIGKKLYIISKGVVELLKTEKMRRVDTRADGGHFGMISIVPNGPTKGKRVCSIRTMTYCDFRTISKRAFNRGLRRYPGVKEDVEHLVAKEFEDFTKMCERTLNPLGGAGRAMQDTMHTMLAAGGLFGLDHGNDGRIGEDDEQSQDGAVKEGINVVETASLATSPPASPKLSARRRRGTTRAQSISNALGNVFRSNSPRSSKEGGSGGGVVGGVEADPGDGSLAACTPTKKKGRAKSAMRRHSDLRQRRNSDLRVEIEGEDVPHSDEDDEDGAMKVLTRSTSMEGRLQVDRLRKLMDRLEDFLNRVAPEGKSESKSSSEEGASEGRTDDVDGEIGGTDEKGVLPGIG